MSSWKLARDLTSGGIQYDVVPGLDHDDMLDQLDLVLPTIAAWLADSSSRERHAPEHDHGNRQPR